MGDKSTLWTAETRPKIVRTASIDGGRAAPAVTLARMIRELTDDGRLLVETLAEILVDPDASRRDRTEAAKALLERGYGAPLRTELQITAQASDGAALSALADGELARLADLLAGSSQAPRAPIAPSLEAMGRSDILPEYRSLPPESVAPMSVDATPPAPQPGETDGT